MTTTDLGLRKDGGILSRRFSVSSVGSARAGMYWKCAVCSDDRMRAVSTIAPIYALYVPAPARLVELRALTRLRASPLVSWDTSDWAWASSRTRPSEFCERQETCCSAGRLKQLSLILMPRLRAAISARDLSFDWSARKVNLTSLR